MSGCSNKVFDLPMCGNLPYLETHIDSGTGVHLRQRGGLLNVGDIIEIRDRTDGGHFYGLTAECVESDGHPEYPYRCTVRLPEGMEAHRNVVSEEIDEDAMIYEDYWPAHYVIISRAK